MKKQTDIVFDLLKLAHEAYNADLKKRMEKKKLTKEQELEEVKVRS